MIAGLQRQLHDGSLARQRREGRVVLRQTQPHRVRNHAPRPAGHAGRREGPAPGRQRRGRVRQVERGARHLVRAPAALSGRGRKGGPGGDPESAAARDQGAPHRPADHREAATLPGAARQVRPAGRRYARPVPPQPGLHPVCHGAGAGGRPLSRAGLRLRRRDRRQAAADDVRLPRRPSMAGTTPTCGRSATSRPARPR